MKMDQLDQPNVEVTVGVTVRAGVPYIESRARPVGSGGNVIPPGKILVMRTPILPPGASDAAIQALTEQELVDDDGVFCPHCAAGLH